MLSFGPCRALQWELPVMVLQLHQSAKKVKRTRDIISTVIWGSCLFFHFCQSFLFLPMQMHHKLELLMSEFLNVSLILSINYNLNLYVLQNGYLRFGYKYFYGFVCVRTLFCSYSYQFVVRGRGGWEFFFGKLPMYTSSVLGKLQRSSEVT